MTEPWAGSKWTEWKFLCSTHTACPKVMHELENMGFENVKETPKSPTSDIVATLGVNNDKEIDKKADEIFKKLSSDIQQITIAPL